MISDNDLYSLAIFLGSLSMLLIVLYHFLEINAEPENQKSSRDGLGTANPAPRGQGKESVKS